jgi:hypothetical protein
MGLDGTETLTNRRNRSIDAVVDRFKARGDLQQLTAWPNHSGNRVEAGGWPGADR